MNTSCKGRNSKNKNCQLWRNETTGTGKKSRPKRSQISAKEKTYPNGCSEQIPLCFKSLAEIRDRQEL